MPADRDVSSVAEAASQAERLIQPALVAVYEADHRGRPRQIGTGFLVLWRDRPFVVTAKHTLYGHSYDEDPAEKLIFADGRLDRLPSFGIDQIVKADEFDVAGFYADIYEPERCLSSDSLFRSSREGPNLITIFGYLARDFRRNDATLRPKPWLYTDVEVAGEPGYVTMAYPKNRALETRSSRRTMTSRPEGLSGCPMLDAADLARGQVSIRGLFTDQPPESGVAFGEDVQKVQALLSRL
jgi:hypothetical protein